MTSTATFWHTPESSAIATVRYSDEAALDVEFRNGLAYRYFAVPRTVVEALLAAESKGAYLNKFIKQRFTWRRL